MNECYTMSSLHAPWPLSRNSCSWIFNNATKNEKNIFFLLWRSFALTQIIFLRSFLKKNLNEIMNTSKTFHHEFICHIWSILLYCDHALMGLYCKWNIRHANTASKKGKRQVWYDSRCYFMLVLTVFSSLLSTKLLRNNFAVVSRCSRNLLAGSRLL